MSTMSAGQAGGPGGGAATTGSGAWASAAPASGTSATGAGDGGGGATGGGGEGAHAAAARGAAAAIARAAIARWRRLVGLCMADAYGGPARSARDEARDVPAGTEVPMRGSERPGDCSRSLPMPCSAAAPLMNDVASAPKPDKPEPILFATAARGTEGAVRDELRE